MRPSWFYENRKNESVNWISHFFEVDKQGLTEPEESFDCVWVYIFERLLLVMKLKLQFLFLNKAIQLFCLFLVECLEVKDLELLFSYFLREKIEIWNAHCFGEVVSEPHERFTQPTCGVWEEHWYVWVAHVFFIVQPDFFNNTRFFSALDIYVIIGVEDTNFLVPKDQREYPVAAVPAWF